MSRHRYECREIRKPERTIIMGLHMPELIIVLVVALLIFGPKKLPEMGSAIGKSIQSLRKGMSEITHPEEAELSNPPAKDTLPDPEKDVSNQTSIAATSKELGAEKHVD
jgi:sec-independent protein translocase protein TatA